MIVTDNNHKRPVHPKKFKMRADRFKDRKGDFFIAPILASECSMVLEAYYGGPIRAGLHTIRWGIVYGVGRRWTHLLLAFCDRIGWTRLQRIPGTAHFERHGAHCPHNCQDFNCIGKSIPKWFRVLARWHTDL